jgi:hypothetical protein
MNGRIAALAVTLGVFALVAAPLAGAKHKPGHGNGHGSKGGNSGAAHKCQKGGWKSLVGADGMTFKNTGACVSFAARGGTFATGLIIPLGKTATLSNAQFGDFYPTAPLAPNTFTNCPADPLAYGYQVNLGTVTFAETVCFREARSGGPPKLPRLIHTGRSLARFQPRLWARAC